MLYAMFMLVILTVVIMVLTARVRMGSVKSGAVPESYYNLMGGARGTRTRREDYAQF